MLSPTNKFDSENKSNDATVGIETSITPPGAYRVVSFEASARSALITSNTVVVPVKTNEPVGTVFSTISIGNVFPIDAPDKSIAL